MKKLDSVVVADNATSASLWKRFRWYDLPKVVIVGMTVTCHLLPCGRMNDMVILWSSAD